MSFKMVYAAVGIVFTLQANAANWCHPRDNTARILASPNPNDLHKDWTGESYVGMSWALAPGRVITVDDIVYIEGDLYSPRGGLVNPRIYVLRKEWQCE